MDIPSGKQNIAIRSVRFDDIDGTINVNAANVAVTSDRIDGQARAKAMAGDSGVSTALSLSSGTPSGIRSSSEFDYIVDFQSNAVSRGGTRNQARAAANAGAL